jgi:hypothetical protein
MTTNENDPPSAFDKATDAVRGASEAVQRPVRALRPRSGKVGRPTASSTN